MEVYKENDMSLGEFIREVYMSKEGGKMTIQQIADACGVTQATISRLINNKSDLTIEMAFKLEKRSWSQCSILDELVGEL